MREYTRFFGIDVSDSLNLDKIVHDKSIKDCIITDQIKGVTFIRCTFDNVHMFAPFKWCTFKDCTIKSITYHGDDDPAYDCVYY